MDANSSYEINTINFVWVWRNGIIDYLDHGKLLEDSKASWVIHTKAARIGTTTSRTTTLSSISEAIYEAGNVHHWTAVVGSRFENKENHIFTLSPSAKGQAESTNKVIMQNLKKRLDAAKAKWPEELPGVLWAYQTTTKSSTGETPVSLVYGGEALISVEVREPILRYF
uniref:Uncharacterized protein LOC104221079 n=1 Tax=Nicotiana sylvestris TaxID=4096 RepID=A0A1U7VZG9_NICSY|nr:PREDICTED: uncharacterized protein LOC104221079 [Nicotiana sylvestris]